MKTKTFLLTVFALAFLIGATGCDKNEEIKSDIIGTWKLVGFGNTADDCLKEPKDCDKCFILTFKKDNTLEGRSIMNTLAGDYTISGKNIFLHVGGTKIGEIGDGENFIESLRQVNRFTVQDSELYLYFSDKYLLFKKIN